MTHIAFCLPFTPLAPLPPCTLAELSSTERSKQAAGAGDLAQQRAAYMNVVILLVSVHAWGLS